METIVYISIALLYCFCGYLLYLGNKIQRKLKEQDERQKKALVEAGNALTDTLRVAFDNLKRNSNDHNKINSKITEHSSRIHRLEQHTSRTSKDFDRRKPIAEQNSTFSDEKEEA